MKQSAERQTNITFEIDETLPTKPDAVLKNITERVRMCEQDSERHLQACISALTGHAGFRSGGEDEDDDGEGDCCCGSGTEECSSMQTGLIQKAFVFPLPFLLVPLCWSVWNMPSLLLLCKRSLCSSLSTRWMIHSRLLSTFPHTFSCDKETVCPKCKFWAQKHA